MKKVGKKSRILLAALLVLGVIGCGQENHEIQETWEAVGQQLDAKRDETTGWMTWNGSRALLSYPTDKTADEMLAMTKDGSLSAEFVVTEDSVITHGEDTWDAFFQMTREGKDAQIQIAHYYTLDREGVSEEYYEENKDKYPVIYLSSLLHYEGRYYYLVRGYNTTEIENGDYCEWNYLLKLYDEPTNVSATFIYCEHYVLVNDETLTWRKIEHGMFSSQLGDYIPNRMVLSKYQWKESQE